MAARRVDAANQHPIVLEEGEGGGGRQDPFVVHRDVIAMFPELDLTQTLNEFGHMTSEALAGLIIDRMARLPKKQHGVKRKGGTRDEVDDNSVLSDDSSSSTDDHQGELLLDKLFGELLRYCKTELRSKKTVIENKSVWGGIKTFMLEQFPTVRADFTLKMINVFDGAIVPTAIACFFVENHYGAKLQKFAPKLNQAFWCKAATPMNEKRPRKFKHAFVPELVHEHFKLYTALMRQYQEKYPELLESGNKLTKDARNHLWERSETEKRVECLVCMDSFPVTRMVCCSAPVAPQQCFFADSSQLNTDSSQLSSASDVGGQAENGQSLSQQQGISAAAEPDDDDDDYVPLFSPNINILDFVVPTPVITIDDDETKNAQTHAFCHGCIRGHAQAATENTPLADGAVGLKCMMTDCQNPILYSDIRTYLKRDIRKKLDERIVEENIATLENIERCKICNFAIEMEVDKRVNKVFDCLNCGAQFCRLCEQRWDEDHFGISCDELNTKMKLDKRERALENELNEAVIRKCPRCGLAFMKDMGCNRMTCRCGMRQCYICRKSPIDYDHFCQHFRDPTVRNWKCNQCTKKCTLYQDAEKLDSKVLEEIVRRQHQQPAADDENGSGEGTSQQAAAAGVPRAPETRAVAPVDPRRALPAERERAGNLDEDEESSDDE